MLKQNVELLDRLYRDNYVKVYKLALSLSSNVHDAEDITQEAFSRAFRSYGSFREESSFFTWIYRIAINVANDYMKYRNKLPIYTLTEDLGYALEDIIDPNPANNPETELLAYQVRVKCLHCLTECLPAGQRMVFCLAIIIGLRHKCIAQIMDCSVSSVKTALHRAKKRWFGYMENRCQLIKKSNPCNCKQFVRFGLKRGWISKDVLVNPRPQSVLQAKEEITKLKILQNSYRDLYQDTADASFSQRIKDGINDKEWLIFSDML
jgi:RNA polymerase sigma-70 factor (ECF subfamily)